VAEATENRRPGGGECGIWIEVRQGGGTVGRERGGVKEKGAEKRVPGNEEQLARRIVDTQGFRSSEGNVSR
jgi:hypothetical protein